MCYEHYATVVNGSVSINKFRSNWQLSFKCSVKRNMSQRKNSFNRCLNTVQVDGGLPFIRFHMWFDSHELTDKIRTVQRYSSFRNIHTRGQHSPHLLCGSLACCGFSVNQTQNLCIGNDWANVHFPLCLCPISPFECKIPNWTKGTETLKTPGGIFKQWGKVIHWAINLCSVLTVFFHPHIPIRHPDLLPLYLRRSLWLQGSKH